MCEVWFFLCFRRKFYAFANDVWRVSVCACACVNGDDCIGEGWVHVNYEAKENMHILIIDYFFHWNQCSKWPQLTNHQRNFSERHGSDFCSSHWLLWHTSAERSANSPVSGGFSICIHIYWPRFFSFSFSVRFVYLFVNFPLIQIFFYDCIASTHTFFSSSLYNCAVLVWLYQCVGTFERPVLYDRKQRREWRWSEWDDGTTIFVCTISIRSCYIKRNNKNFKNIGNVIVAGYSSASVEFQKVIKPIHTNTTTQRRRVNERVWEKRETALLEHHSIPSRIQPEKLRAHTSDDKKRQAVADKIKRMILKIIAMVFLSLLAAAFFGVA